MKYRFSLKRLALACLVLSFIGFFYTLLSLTSVENENLKRDNDINSRWGTSEDNRRKNRHRLAVIVPFRDRLEELTEFAPHMSKFLRDQNVEHTIYVINQGDNYRFNRGALINIGFLESARECDYLAMHDVDLLPLNPQLPYSYPGEGPFHVAAPGLHPLYNYTTFVGGILLLTVEQFRLVDGLSNNYWGWGREDDEFYVRMKKAELQIFSPGNMSTGRYDTFKHVHDKRRRKRDQKRYWDQKKLMSKRDKNTGAHNVKYTVLNKAVVAFDGAPTVFYNVHLECDLEVTPWCLRPDQMTKQQLAAAEAGLNRRAEQRANNDRPR